MKKIKQTCLRLTNPLVNIKLGTANSMLLFSSTLRIRHKSLFGKRIPKMLRKKREKKLCPRVRLLSLSRESCQVTRLTALLLTIKVCQDLSTKRELSNLNLIKTKCLMLTEVIIIDRRYYYYIS